MFWGRPGIHPDPIPFFPGKKDGRCWPTFEQMIKVNPGGYDFFSTKPGDLITKGAEKWRKMLAKEKKASKN